MILCYVLTLISFLSTKAENIEQKQAAGKRPSINCINPQVADILKNEEVRSSLQLHCSNPTPYCDFEMNVCISSDENGEDMVSVRPALRTNESPAAAYHWRNTLRAGLTPSRPPPHKPVLWGHYNNIKSGHRSLESPGYWKKWTKPKTGKKRIPGGTISGASDRRREPRRNRGKTLGRRKLETEIQRQEGGPPARKIPGSAGRRKGPPPGRRKPLLPGRTKGQPPGRRKLGPPSGRIQQSPGRRRKLQRPPPGPKLSQGRGQRDATTKKSSRYKKNAPKGKEKKTLTGKKKKRHEGNGKKPSTSTKNTYYRNAKALGNEGVPPESGVWSVKPKRSMWRDLSSDDVPGISKTDGPANFCIDPKSRFFKNKNLTSQLSLRCKPPWPYCDFGANRCIRSPVKYFGCEVDGRFPHISDCASYVTCREGKSEETFCPSSMFYNHEQKKCQNGNRKCKKPNCEGVDGLYVKHPEDMSLFVLCIKGKPTSMHSCPPGFLSHDDPYTPCVQDTTCYADGNFPYPSDESRYVSCYDDGEKILKVLKYCPDHTFFVAQSGTCETKT